MDIQNIQYRLRKRRLDEIFDFSILVIRENFLMFVRYALPGILLLSAFNFLVLTELRGEEEPDWFSGEHFVLLLIVLLQQPLFSLPLILLNGNLVFEKKPSFKNVFQGFFSFFFRFLFRTALIRSLFYTVLAPSIITLWFGLIRSFFQNEVILLERLKGKQVSQRLTALSRGRGDRTIAFLIIDFLVAFVFVSIGIYSWNFLIDLIGLKDAHWMLDGNWSLFSPVTHVLLLLYAVFHSTAKFLYYLDTRSNLEGWDIQLMFEKGVRDTDAAGAGAGAGSAG